MRIRTPCEHPFVPENGKRVLANVSLLTRQASSFIIMKKGSVMSRRDNEIILKGEALARVHKIQRMTGISSVSDVLNVSLSLLDKVVEDLSEGRDFRSVGPDDEVQLNLPFKVTKDPFDIEEKAANAPGKARGLKLVHSEKAD